VRRGGQRKRIDEGKPGSLRGAPAIEFALSDENVWKSRDALGSVGKCLTPTFLP
jgi:hypothetical protein